MQLEVLLGSAVATPGDIYERSRRSLSLFPIHSHNQAVQAVPVMAFFFTKPWRLRHRRGADSGRRPSFRRPSGRATSGGNSGRTPGRGQMGIPVVAAPVVAAPVVGPPVVATVAGLRWWWSCRGKTRRCAMDKSMHRARRDPEVVFSIRLI